MARISPKLATILQQVQQGQNRRRHEGGDTPVDPEPGDGTYAMVPGDMSSLLGAGAMGYGDAAMFPPGIGTMDPTAFHLGGTWLMAVWAEGFGVSLALAGDEPNEGFETLTIGELVLNRGDAQFDAVPGQFGWTWASAENPFAIGVESTLIFE